MHHSDAWQLGKGVPGCLQHQLWATSPPGHSSYRLSLLATELRELHVLDHNRKEPKTLSLLCKPPSCAGELLCYLQESWEREGATRN